MSSQKSPKTYRFAGAILEHMPVAVAVYDPQDFRLLEANTLFLTIMDLFLDPSRHEGRLIGYPLTDWAHPVAIPRLTAIFRTVAETGTPYREGEFAFSTSHGNLTYWNWTVDRMCDHHGHNIHLLQTLTNVTAQVLARRASEQAHASLSQTTDVIEAERARLRTVLDQLPEGVIIIEASDGRVSYANVAAERIVGTPESSLIGGSLSQHPHSRLVTYLDGRPIPNEDFSPLCALQGETKSNREVMMTRRDGSKVMLLTDTVPLRLQSGAITGSVSVLQDITERKSQEQQKNQFLSLASHELRTPITSIGGLAEILQRLIATGQSLDTPHGVRAITIMAEQSQRLTRLIEEMLDLSRIENAQLRLYLAPHDLVQTLVRVIESQAVTTRQHGIRLVLDGLQASDPLIISFDEERMVQVLSNLISNAIKYSPAGGEIEVGLQQNREQPDEVLMWVRDGGIGIPADALPYVFEQFYRSAKLNHAMRGLGIGLFLVHEIVTDHGGHVRVESVEGQGSTFYVILPLNNR